MPVPDETSQPQIVHGPGTPDQKQLIPNVLQPAQKGPAYAYMTVPNCGVVTDINPVPPPPCVRNGAC